MGALLLLQRVGHDSTEFRAGSGDIGVDTECLCFLGPGGRSWCYDPPLPCSVFSPAARVQSGPFLLLPLPLHSRCSRVLRRMGSFTVTPARGTGHQRVQSRKRPSMVWIRIDRAFLDLVGEVGSSTTVACSTGRSSTVATCSTTRISTTRSSTSATSRTTATSVTGSSSSSVSSTSECCSSSHPQGQPVSGPWGALAPRRPSPPSLVV